MPSYVKAISQEDITSWNDKAEISDIPTSLSELSEDATHRTATDTEKQTWNNKSTVSVSQTLTSGTEVGSVTVDGTETKLYAPSGGGSSDKVLWYGTCSSGSATATKIVTCQDFVLTTGCQINIKFTSTNTATTVNLNVNDTGAIQVYQYGSTSTITTYSWRANDVVSFVYDGTHWMMMDKDMATTTYAGLVKLNTTVGNTSTTTSATPSMVTNAIGALDYTDTEVDGQYISAVNEVDGIINVTRKPLPSSSGFELLWENSSTSSYTTPDVLLSIPTLYEYRFILIVFGNTTASKNASVRTITMPVVDGTYSFLYNISYATTASAWVYSRRVDIRLGGYGDTGVIFANGYRKTIDSSTASTSGNNTYSVPYYIYGIK